MIIGLFAAMLIAQATPQNPVRVVPGETPETKTIYRQIKAGEQRVEGLLRRIECPPGRPVAFVLEVMKKPERYAAPTLASVEFVAHTPTFRGPVTCGGKTPPERVYLTWKTVAGAPRVIAVEFLPSS
jgi:hypothetical protein